MIDTIKEIKTQFYLIYLNYLNLNSHMWLVATIVDSTDFSSVKSLSHVPLFEIPWTAACQASLSITNSQSLLKLMSIESVMP